MPGSNRAASAERHSAAIEGEEETDEGTHLLPGSGGLLRKAESGRKSAREIFQNLRAWDLESSAQWFLVTWLFFVVFATITVATVLSAKDMVGGATALLHSDHCGSGKLPEDSSNGARARAAAIDRQKEQRAGEYAANCYKKSGSLSPQGCNIFTEPNITYTRTYEQDCPFDESICAYSSTTATQSIKFDTGLLDATYLGLNIEHPYKFRRASTCAALSSDYPFVQNRTEYESTAYFYYYGSKYNDDGEKVVNYTYRTLGDISKFPLPSYLVATYPTTGRPETDYWRPRPSSSRPRTQH